MVDLPDDLQRFLELLHYKIGHNVLARVTIAGNDNPRLRTVRYQTASTPGIRFGDDSISDATPVHGELATNADLSQRVFRFALDHEDARTPFGMVQVIFYDVLDHKHEGFQSFVVLFFSPGML